MTNFRITVLPSFQMQKGQAIPPGSTRTRTETEKNFFAAFLGRNGSLESAT